jgi:hypothetical protein
MTEYRPDCPPERFKRLPPLVMEDLNRPPNGFSITPVEREEVRLARAAGVQIDLHPYASDDELREFLGWLKLCRVVASVRTQGSRP